MASNYSADMFASSEMDEDGDITIVQSTRKLSLGDCACRHGLFEKPACLIYTDDKGKLEINNSVLCELSKINKKISVVGICGLYRSGKSYLMNLIAGDRKGFSLGDTIQSETKGIWVWCKKHPTKEDTVLVLVDTEGLNDPDKGDPDHDNYLFCLTLLISSTLIINVMRVFNYDTLDKLAFIGTLAHNIKILDAEEEHNEEFVSVVSPRLVMCIRDSHLKNIKDGRHYTPDEYLDENLKLKLPAKTKQIEQYNKTKKAIKQFFPKRKCFTVAQPAMGNDLQNIESLDDTKIDQKFLQDMEALKKYVYKKKPKSICTASKKMLKGADLANLIKSYVRAIRENNPICYKDAYADAAKERNERILQDIIENCKKDMEKGLTMTSKTELHDLFLQIFENGFCSYRDECFTYDQEEYEEKARTEMKSHHEWMKKELKKRCQDQAAGKLSGMYDTMLKTNKDIYSEAGGYDRYEKHMDALQQQLFEEMAEYDKDDLCLAFKELKRSKKDERMADYRAASEDRARKQYQTIHDKLSKEMYEKLQRAVEFQTKLKNEYLQKELDALRAKHEILGKMLNKKRRTCSIM